MLPATSRSLCFFRLGRTVFVFAVLYDYEGRLRCMPQRTERGVLEGRILQDALTKTLI
jgi:hypothetical protein